MTAAAAVGGFVAIAALVSPPLPMFPPQGAPQPGGGGPGGAPGENVAGALPVSVASVRIVV